MVCSLWLFWSMPISNNKDKKKRSFTFFTLCSMNKLLASEFPCRLMKRTIHLFYKILVLLMILVESSKMLQKIAQIFQREHIFCLYRRWRSTFQYRSPFQILSESVQSWWSNFHYWVILPRVESWWLTEKWSLLWIWKVKETVHPFAKCSCLLAQK